MSENQQLSLETANLVDQPNEENLQHNEVDEPNEENLQDNEVDQPIEVNLQHNEVDEPNVENLQDHLLCKPENMNLEKRCPPKVVYDCTANDVLSTGMEPQTVHKLLDNQPFEDLVPATTTKCDANIFDSKEIIVDVRQKRRQKKRSKSKSIEADEDTQPSARRSRKKSHRSADSAAVAITPATADGLEFESSELCYIIVYGLPVSVCDAALHRAFRRIFRRRLLADSDELVVVPESDSKTVLMFAGSSQECDLSLIPSRRGDKGGWRLSARRVERRLRSSHFESRFPETTQLDCVRVLASDSQDYLRRWTRMYFCPVPLKLAEDIQCQHLLASNLPANILHSPDSLLRRFTQIMPEARSFFLPVDDLDHPLGYLLIRFDQASSCLACLNQLRRHYSLELSCVSLLEVCRLPCGYRIPVHNLLNWCCLDRSSVSAGEPLSARVLATAHVILDDPIHRPFVCTCHPDALHVAPPPHRLSELANELASLESAGGPTGLNEFLATLARLS